MHILLQLQKSSKFFQLPLLHKSPLCTCSILLLHVVFVVRLVCKKALKVFNTFYICTYAELVGKEYSEATNWLKTRKMQCA
jgi:hypothetical protein